MKTVERQSVTDADLEDDERLTAENFALEHDRGRGQLVRRMAIRRRIEEMLEDRSIEIDAISEREWIRQQRLKRLDREKQTRQMY